MLHEKVIMESEKPRLARLTAILTQLQANRMITATELAKYHEVSVRTIYRDVKTLIQSGIPIYTEEGKGYSLMDHYRLPPISFTADEANALVTAEHILKLNSDASFVKSFQSATQKIKAVLKHSEKSKTDLLNERLHVRNWVQHPSQNNSSNNLSSIQNAITNYCIIHIDYTSLQGEDTSRKIEPFALYSTQGNWILVAFCLLRKEWRSFRLDYIQSLNILEETFAPHQFTLQDFFDQYKRKYESENQ